MQAELRNAMGGPDHDHDGHDHDHHDHDHHNHDHHEMGM